MGLLSQNSNEINNELSALLRVIHTRYRNDIKLLIVSAPSIREFKVKILRKKSGYYKFLFLIKIPKDYPYGPLWAEPVIVSREMMTQFYHQNFKYYKLRPLIDSLIMFCRKYDSDNLETIHVSFPLMRMYGERDITPKIFTMLNKTISKFSSRYSFDFPNQKFSKSVLNYRTSHSNDYYNDMGMNMFSYIDMVKKITSPKRDRRLLPTIPLDRHSKSESKDHKPLLLITGSKEIKRHISKTLFSQLTKRTISKVRDKHIKEIRLCKLNLTKMKNIIDPFKVLLKSLTETDIVEELSVDIEESFRASLDLIRKCTSTKHDLSKDYINIVQFTYMLSEDKPFNMKIEMPTYVECQALLPIHSREIIPINHFYEFTIFFIKLFQTLHQMDTDKLDDYSASSSPVQEQRLLSITDLDSFSLPLAVLNCPQLFEGFLVEESEHEYQNNTMRILSDVCEENHLIDLPLKQKVRLWNDLKTLTQPFLKNRIAEQLMLHDDLTDIDSYGNGNQTKQTRSPLTMLYSEIISEVIQYHKTENTLFEYTLELNPRSTRHRTLLDSIGLLKNKHYTPLEILAPNDYNVQLFFIKEIFNPNGRGVVIKLHKLSSTNIIYKLILEENKYLQNLSKTNKSVWITEMTSTFNFDTLNLIYNLGKMYFQKLKRYKQMETEASTFNCTDLTIQRYQFPTEIVASLSIFNNCC